MPKSISRPSLATSSSAFALPQPSASASPAADGELLPSHRLRRSSLMAPKALHASHSPLASSFAAPYPHRRKSIHRSSISSETGSESDRMLQDSSPSSSENPTPPLPNDSANDDTPKRLIRCQPPSTPPRRSSIEDDLFSSARRPGLAVKTPRIISLLSESRPEEIEMKSEAAFQRLVSSNSLPLHPHTPRGSIDRGRYPEEANTEELQREDTPSDDEDFYSQFAFQPPASIDGGDRSAGQSVAGDDPPSVHSLDSNAQMDIDMTSGSPSVQSSMTQWRYTPPPTSCAVRSNKRKLEDRFDPYPTAAKRRAVSPSVAHLREAHSISGTPTQTQTQTRPQRIAIPISIPNSNITHSATSSPTVSNSYPISRTLPMTSSPTLRSTMSLASPIVRTIPRPRKDNEEREVDGTGDAVNGLSIV